MLPIPESGHDDLGCSRQASKATHLLRTAQAVSRPRRPEDSVSYGHGRSITCRAVHPSLSSKGFLDSDLLQHKTPRSHSVLTVKDPSRRVDPCTGHACEPSPGRRVLLLRTYTPTSMEYPSEYSIARRTEPRSVGTQRSTDAGTAPCIRHAPHRLRPSILRYALASHYQCSHSIRRASRPTATSATEPTVVLVRVRRPRMEASCGVQRRRVRCTWAIPPVHARQA